MSMTFIMLINIEIPIIVGISTCISMINTTSESLTAKIYLFFSFIVFIAVEISCSVELSMNKVL